MPEPKISRRCPTCGVSIRDEAFFCPQCGDKIDRPTPTVSGIHDTEEVIAAESQALTQKDVSTGTETTIVETREAARARPKAGRGSKFQRVTKKARNVEGDVIQRVQKIRNISNVVIDEASYDPSLRFVLVAAALFVVFLVIVLLNNVIN